MSGPIIRDVFKRTFEEAFNRWNDGLHVAYLNIEEVKRKYPEDSPGRQDALLKAVLPIVDCYAEGAVLHPTVSDITRKDPKAIGEYFIHFAEQNPKGVVIELDQAEPLYDKFGCPDSILVSGLYNFTLTDAGGKEKVVPCRFVFRVTPSDVGTPPKWLFHSSNGLPEQMAAPAPHHNHGPICPSGERRGCNGDCCSHEGGPR